MIQEFTGHHSLKVLRQYEKVAVNQEHGDRMIVDKGKSIHFQPANNISNSGTSLPFHMPSFSPVLNSNSNGTINFTVNICPSGSISIGNSNGSDPYQDLFADIDLKDFFDD